MPRAGASGVERTVAREGGVVAAIHPGSPRVLTAREMARLQSFPDSFALAGSKSEQLVQIGNAVPPLVAKAVGLALRAMAGEFPTETARKRLAGSWLAAR